MTLREYRAHVEWTAGLFRDEPPAVRAPPRLGDARTWRRLVASFEQRIVKQAAPRWLPAIA